MNKCNENNPKTLHSLIKKLKSYYKNNPDADPHKMAYSLYGYPTCPKDPSLNMKYLGHCREKGRTAYTYENMDFRMFPGIQRDTKEWDDLHKIRTIVERSINHFKTNMCIAGQKTRSHATTKADVFLAGIASQLTVIVAIG